MLSAAHVVVGVAAASAPRVDLWGEETFETSNRTVEVGSVTRVGHISLEPISRAASLFNDLSGTAVGPGVVTFVRRFPGSHKRLVGPRPARPRCQVEAGTSL